MLVRLIIENLFSFGQRREFNLLPAPHTKKKTRHKLKAGSTEVVKLSALYGANASGKSNLIKSSLFLQQLILDDNFTLHQINRHKYKPYKGDADKQIVLAVEFTVEQQLFTYAIEIGEKYIRTEELYHSGEEEALIYERNTDQEGKTTTRFFDDFEKDTEGSVLKRIIEKNLSKPHRPLLRQLAELDSTHLKAVKQAYSWFSDVLEIVTPDHRPLILPHMLEKDKAFKEATTEMLQGLDTGIQNLEIVNMPTDKLTFVLNDPGLETILKEMEDAPEGELRVFGREKHKEIVLVKEGGVLYAKTPVFMHRGFDEGKGRFFIFEESDGTIRLMDYMPLFYDLLREEKVYLVDEIERSIHPLLIKTLIQKFSDSEDTKGQLIFTTHEAQLLDQRIFRQDEIWFVEKDGKGCTDIYPLSEFKEHHTKNIRNGYLNGRYGAIPFMGDLEALNWEKYATY